MADVQVPLGSSTGSDIRFKDIQVPLYGIPGETPPVSQEPRGFLDELFRKVGITARGATAPAVGAYFGSKLPLPPNLKAYTTLAGAGLLTAADLATLGLDAAGMDIQKYPSDYIKEKAGFPTPETTFEKVLEAGAEGIAGVRPSVEAFNILSKDATGKTKKFLEFLGGEKNLQALASGSGAAASQYGLATTNDPAKSFGYGLLGGLPFSLLSPRATIKQGAQELKRQARDSYKVVEDLGVGFSKPKFVALKDDIEKKVKPLIGSLVEKNDKGMYKLDPNVGSAEVVTGTPKTLRYLNELNVLANAKVGDKRITFDDLQTLRSNINRSIMKSSDEESNALRVLRDSIDEFVDKAEDNALATFKGPTNKALEAKNALKKAKDAWRRGSRAELLEEFNQQALIRAGRSQKDVSQIMFDRLETMRKRKDFNKLFSVEERQAIDKALEGGAGSDTFRAVQRGLNQAGNALGLGGGYYALESLPEEFKGAAIPILGAPYAGAALSGKIASNLEQRSLAALEDMIRKGKPLNILEQLGANVVNPALISGRSATGSLGGMAGLLGI
jgi:hypothetical protein